MQQLLGSIVILHTEARADEGFTDKDVFFLAFALPLKDKTASAQSASKKLAQSFLPAYLGLPLGCEL